MALHHLYLIIHLLSATIWAGGHLILAVGVLPKALKFRDFKYIYEFEKPYSAIGMPSLLFLVITGVLMAYDFGIRTGVWFSFTTPTETVVSLKLICLLLTVCLAISANVRLIPKLKKGDMSKLNEMSVHIICVTLLGVTMVILGSFIRYGGFML